MKLRGVQLAVPELSGSTSNGSIACVEASTSDAWLAGSDLGANSSLVCTGSYTFDQDAIELGDEFGHVSVSASNLDEVTADLPAISVPNTPSLSVTVDTSGCSKPSNAGGLLRRFALAKAQGVCLAEVSGFVIEQGPFVTGRLLRSPAVKPECTTHLQGTALTEPADG